MLVPPFGLEDNRFDEDSFTQVKVVSSSTECFFMTSEYILGQSITVA